MATSRTGLALLGLLTALLHCGPAAAAGSIAVTVLDRDGEPVGDVAVYALPLDSAAPPPQAGASAAIEQIGNEFVPHLLVVQTGTEVGFPNNDSVSHHVYSFSDAKPFELALYKGDVHPPVRFDRPGVVVLGCNIHDRMLGYILVVDTPYFGRTDARGAATLGGLPAGNYDMRIWTPRARNGALPAAVTVAVDDAGRQSSSFRFTAKLMPAHEHGATGLTWDRY